MPSRILKAALIDTNEPRSFDESFFDFTDTVFPWSTVYRFFLLTDVVKKTQLMFGIGQKNTPHYRVNGKRMIFSNTHPSYKVCIPYWLDNGNVIQEVRNDEIYVKDGIVGKYFSFKREDS